MKKATEGNPKVNAIYAFGFRARGSECVETAPKANIIQRMHQSDKIDTRVHLYSTVVLVKFTEDKLL